MLSEFIMLNFFLHILELIAIGWIVYRLFKLEKIYKYFRFLDDVHLDLRSEYNKAVKKYKEILDKRLNKKLKTN